MYYKKTLIVLTIILGLLITISTAKAVSITDQGKITSILEKAGLQSMWAGTSNLWIKNPGYDKYTLEGFAHQLCSGTRGKGVGGYRVTFWHQFGSGEIARVHCKK